MAPAKNKEPGKRICVHKGCTRRIGLKRSKSGNWYCAQHHPELKAKTARTSREGGKKSGKARRIEKLLLTLNIQGNKKSVVEALVAQANFLGKDVTQKEIKRNKLISDILKAIHEFATEGTGEEEKDQKVEAIMSSTLPDQIKLLKLVDIVGPQKATELVKVTIVRDGYEEKTLDGQQLLAGGMPGQTISTPDSFKVEESNNTEDLPEVGLGPVPEGILPQGQGPQPGAPQAPPEANSPAKESPEERKVRCMREANELVGLYKVKVVGNFKPLDQVGKLFFAALFGDGVPFRDLQQRVMFPKSDTDQPEMMVKDVKAAMPKKESA